MLKQLAVALTAAVCGTFSFSCCSCADCPLSSAAFVLVLEFFLVVFVLARLPVYITGLKTTFMSATAWLPSPCQVFRGPADSPSLAAKLTPASLVAQKVCVQNACLSCVYWLFLSCVSRSLPKVLGCCSYFFPLLVCELTSSRCFATLLVMFVRTARTACFSRERPERKPWHTWSAPLHCKIAPLACPVLCWPELNITPAFGIPFVIHRPLSWQVSPSLDQQPLKHRLGWSWGGIRPSRGAPPTIPLKPKALNPKHP